MKNSSSIVDTARRYGHRHLMARIRVEALRWAPPGLLLGSFTRYLAVSENLFPPWVCFPAAILPSAVAAVVGVLRSGGILGALSWLDRAIGGRQELQAAWECRDSASPLGSLVRGAGARILQKHDGNTPVPGSGALSLLLTSASALLFFLVLIVGGTLFAPSSPEFRGRGTEMEAWAESWAERADGTGRPESRELAGRMGELGRRMADGGIGERQSQRALKELEEEIQERRNELLREKLAETLVEDLGFDRESAEMFRIHRRRLPSDVLAELGQAARGSPSVSEMSRDVLDQLLTDPDFRDRLGNGTPELTEKLTEALEDALTPGDPGLNELDTAAEESRKARGEGGSEADGEQQPAGEAADGDSGSRPGSGEGRGESERRDGASGGSGRGSAEIEDDPGDPKQPFRSTAEQPLHLPSDSERTGTWRTVIRAYTEDGAASPTPGADPAAEWRGEVESVIRREDIPPRTRDYVRDYFLALEEGPVESEEEE